MTIDLRLPYLTITYYDAFKINSTVVHEKPYYQIQIIHSLQSQDPRTATPFSLSSTIVAIISTIDNLTFM